MKGKIAHWNALMTPLIFAINENCYSFDWGRGIYMPCFSVATAGAFGGSSVVASRELAIHGKKKKQKKRGKERNACALGLAGGGMGAAGIAWYIILTKKEDIWLSYDLKKCNADLRKCCPPRLTLLDFQNSLDYTQPHSVITRYLTLLPFYAICTGRGLIIQG